MQRGFIQLVLIPFFLVAFAILGFFYLRYYYDVYRENQLEKQPLKSTLSTVASSVKVCKFACIQGSSCVNGECIANNTNESTPSAEIVRQIMTSYLDGYKDKSAGDKRIADYTIDKIGPAQLNSGRLTFYVVFSIKPLGENSQIIGTDNGVDSPDGWIRNKSGGALAVQENGVYKIQGIATGFGSSQ